MAIYSEVSLRPGLEVGRYRIVSELGRGGMGVVFRASDKVLGREVALKILRPDDRAPTSHSSANLLREARAAAAISHPNAVSVYDIGDVDGVPYIAMELVEGKTLRSYVGDPSLPVGTRLRWLIDVARALEAANSRDVIHGDVKPENILVRVDGVIKVLDFGIARHARQASPGAAASDTPTRPVGTLAYMAPEQARGESIDITADEFAWGVVAYELLAGTRPWISDEDSFRAFGDIAWRDPVHVCESNPGVPRPFGDVVMRALSRARTGRFASMRGLLETLEPPTLEGPTPAPARKDLSTEDARDGVTTEVSTRPENAREDPTAQPAAGSGLPPRIGGKYVPVRRIAKGGKSTVYEVEHVNTGEHWALKLLDHGVALDPIALDRFKREARVSTQVKSDHIVRVIDADVAHEIGEAPFIVMDLLEGHTLEEFTAGQRQEPSRVLDWMRQVARGLERPHSAGIVHRDLKPGNLFLVKRPNDSTIVKILDFGVAKMGGIGSENATASGTIIGTPQYVSPEQASGGLVGVGIPADIWALGMTTYRLLSGRDYWEGDSIAKVLSLVVFAPIDPPSARGVALGESFDEWFLRSCERDPGRRFSSVTEQMNALAIALGLADAGQLRNQSDSFKSVSGGLTRTPDRVAPEPVRLQPGSKTAMFAVVGGMAMAAVLVSEVMFGHVTRRKEETVFPASGSSSRASLASAPFLKVALPATSGVEAREAPLADERATASGPSGNVASKTRPSRVKASQAPPPSSASARRLPAPDPYADPH